MNNKYRIPNNEANFKLEHFLFDIHYFYSAKKLDKNKRQDTAPPCQSQL